MRRNNIIIRTNKCYVTLC